MVIGVYDCADSDLSIGRKKVFPMKSNAIFLYKVVLLFLLLFLHFTSQKTVTLIVGTNFYSSSSHYRTLQDLSKRAPFPFSKMQSIRGAHNQTLYEGMIVRWEDYSNEP